MEIKKKLKSLDVKLSKLAAGLKVSRPTLDTYIDLYEQGLPIPNDAYQNIFEYLFQNAEEMNTIEFAKKYDYVTRIMLNDASKGAEQIKKDEREHELLEMVQNLINEDLSTPLLNFIRLFVKNKDKDLVNAIYMYFNFINGFEELDSSEVSEIDKTLYSNLHLIFKKYNDNSLELNEEELNEVLTKNKELFEKKKIKVSDSDIVNYIKDNLNDNNEINIDILKSMLASREK